MVVTTITRTISHHFDDNLYGDITELMERAASTSIISLYEILGYPGGRFPDPVSWDKFAAIHGHIRRVIRWNYNSRSLSFSLPDNKRTAIADLFALWLTKSEYTILEVAELQGKLADTSRANRKGRAMFYPFQNAGRRALQSRFHKIRAYYLRNTKGTQLKGQLPKHLHHRLDSLLARDMAVLLWKSNAKTRIDEPVAYEIRQLHSHLAGFTKPWAVNIRYVVARDASFESLGDACLNSGGFYSVTLEMWLDMFWSPHT